MNRQYYSVIFLMAACVILSLMYCPVYDIPSDDKEVFHYAGLVMLKGGVPYRDFFDHKPPLIFFLNYASLLLGSWGLWWIDLGLTMLATAFFYRLCRLYRLPFPWLLPLFFNLMIRNFLICQGIGFTREYTALFQLLFFCILLGSYRYKYFWSGLLTALVFFMQQDQVLFLAPFLLYAILSKDKEYPILTRFLALGGGFLAVTLPILLYFIVHQAVGYFWQDAFRFNFLWYTVEKKSPGDHFRTIKQALDAGNYELPFMIAMTLGLAALGLQNKRKGLLAAAILGMILSFSSELMGGRSEGFSYAYYFIPLATSLSVLLWVVFAFTADQAIQSRPAMAIYGFLLCCSLAYTSIQHMTHLIRYDVANDAFQSPEMDYLRKHRPGDYQVYAFGNSTFIYAYNEFGIRSPSPWIYQHFWAWYDRWDATQDTLRSIGQDLLRHRTNYIIMDSTGFSRFRNPVSRTWWLSFLDEHYRQVPLPDHRQQSLWELKDSVSR